MKKFMAERGFLPLLPDEREDWRRLRPRGHREGIDWKSIPETTSPVLYHRMTGNPAPATAASF
jgi:hypothetical protein